MHLIDDFFHGKLSEEESLAFEERIAKDPAFAADVAFYLSAKRSALEMANEEKKKRYKEIYSATNGTHKKAVPGKVIRMKYVMRVALAAAVITAIFVTFNPFGNPSPADLANRYLKEHPISVTMGIKDEMQPASDLYQEGKYKEALVAFEEIIRKDTLSSKAYENAGRAALEIPDYDRALSHFKKLESLRSLHANPGLLLQAITLMKRNQPGDQAQAKLFLKQVSEQNLEGKKEADKWLKNFPD